MKIVQRLGAGTHNRLVKEEIQGSEFEMLVHGFDGVMGKV